LLRSDTSDLTFLNTMLSKEIKQHIKRWNDKTTKVVVITDTVVARLYGEDFIACLCDNGVAAHLLSFPGDEEHKTRETKQALEDRMSTEGCIRNTCVIGLGGGVVTDMAGFIAATYCRGVEYIAIPTTLLCMVDAALGGKNGVNTPYGKNFVGTFYDPFEVIYNLSFLETLDDAEMKNGYAEMIKHGIIADADYFTFLEENCEAILSREKMTLQYAVQKSVEIKKAIVAYDTKDISLRRVLNFGHTVGHAIEASSGYSIPHGAAVAYGCIIESMLLYNKGILSEGDMRRISSLLKKVFDPLSFSLTQQEEIVHYMSYDKKNRSTDEMACVVVEHIGFSTAECCTVSADEIYSAFSHVFL
jgi:3-dehydroquinate synthase